MNIQVTLPQEVVSSLITALHDELGATKYLVRELEAQAVVLRTKILNRKSPATGTRKAAQKRKYTKRSKYWQG